MRVRPLYLVAMIAVAVEVAAAVVWLVWRRRRRKAAAGPESGW